MLLSVAPFMPVVWALSRLKFFLTYRPMLVLCYYRNTPPNSAFVGIILFGHRLRRPLKKLAILPRITPMETCNTSQVMLRAKPQVYFSIYYQRTTCIVFSPMLSLWGGGPPPRSLLTSLPVCLRECPSDTSMPCFPAGASAGASAYFCIQLR